MPAPISKLLLISLILGYLVFAAALIAGMLIARQSIVPELSSSQSQADWNAWRAEAARQDGTHGPVQRAVPKSQEPPMLVLLRDYFPACVLGLLVPLSALYAVIAWMACGILRQSNGSPSPPGEGRGEGATTCKCSELGLIVRCSAPCSPPNTPPDALPLPAADQSSGMAAPQ
jgi:hypothetical protein